MDYENRKSGRKKKKTRFCSLVVHLFSYFVSRLSKEGALKNTESGSLILHLIYYFPAEGHLGQGDDILIRISLAAHQSSWNWNWTPLPSFPGLVPGFSGAVS